MRTGISSRAQQPSAQPAEPIAEHEMGAWQVHAYGEQLQFSDRVKVPVLSDANGVLVRVSASSVNPIDVAIAKGYGAATLKWMRKGDEFPLTLGRDFVGVVAIRGDAVRDDVRVGDRVWGTVPFQRAGCHAEYTVADANNLSAAPDNVDDANAAAVLYAGLTAWSGLFVSGQLGGRTGATTSLGGGCGKRVCILGASGGVGHLAAQICRAEGVEVVATCAADARELVEAAGVRTVIDYRSADAEQQLVASGPYDIVLDCAGKGTDYAGQLAWKYSKYVTFTSPVMANNDKYGLVCGILRSVVQMSAANLRSLWNCGGLVKWAFVKPCPPAMEYLRRLVADGKVLPVVEQTFDFKATDEAYARLVNGHLRGKIVLKM